MEGQLHGSGKNLRSILLVRKGESKMTNKIGGVDIGNVLQPEPIICRGPRETRVGGGLTYWQNLYSPSIQWRISGYLKAPTTTAVNKLLNLHHGLPVLVDLDDRWSGFITWGRVAEIRPQPPGSPQHHPDAGSERE